MTCEKCRTRMKWVNEGWGKDSGGKDVRKGHYECPKCGHRWRQTY